MATIKARRDRSLVFYKTRYDRSADSAGSHVRYIAFRTRERAGDPYGVFDRTCGHASVKVFVARVAADDRRTLSPRAPRMHRMLFSLRRYHYDRAQLDWRPVVRETMARVEQRLGARLDWVAAIHDNRTHPHVHVAVRALYTDLHGRPHRLTIRQDLREAIRAEADRIVRRELERHRALEGRPRPTLFRTLQGLLLALTIYRQHERQSEQERLQARRRRERDGEEWER